MKLIALILTVLYCNVCFAQINLNQGLVAYYPFSGNANDASGNNLNGTIQGGVLSTTDRFGSTNSAYHFNGTDSRIIVNDNGALSTPSFSICYYFNTEITQEQVLIGKIGYTTGNAATYNSTIFHQGSSLFFSVIDPATYSCNQQVPGTYVYAAFSPVPVNINEWHCVVNSFGNGVQKLYIDGVLVKEQNLSFSQAKNCNNTDFIIGSWWQGDLKPFQGKIDDVRFYNRAINQQEVAALCDQITSIPCSNWLSTPSTPSYAAVGEINIPGDKITVEAVFNRTAPYTGGLLYAGDLVSKHNTTTDVNYLLRPNNAEITTTNGYFRTPDICEIELNKTYHAAMVYDGNTLKFYRNGFLMSQVAATGNLIQNSWKTQIGFYEPGAFNTNFIGYINEVRIWNVDKTQEDVRTYMKSALPNPTTQAGLEAYYTFDNLLNKQGNAAYNAVLGGSAAVNAANSNCNLSVDSCNTVSQQTCNSWLQIPNSQSYVTIGDLDVPGTQLTVEGLFSRESSLTPEGFSSLNIVSKHWTPADVNYLLRVDRAEITTSNGYFSTPDICATENKRIYHVAMTYDGATLKFYRNGFLMSQIACTGTMVQNNYPTTIGATAGNPTTNTTLIGYLNEIRIWNVAKTQAALQTYMNTLLPAPTAQPGLLGYYTFDGLTNKQGNAVYNATLHGSASIKEILPDCSFVVDSCKILSQPATCNGSLGAAVVNIDFGNGATNPGPELSTIVSGASTNYNYAFYATGATPPPPIDGDYALVNVVPQNNGWHSGAADHTGNLNGYMAFFNAAPTPGEFYKQTVSNLCPGTTYEFSAWIANAINPAVLPGAVSPNITFKILDPNTLFVLATYNTGDIPNANTFTWTQNSFLFKMPIGNNAVTLILTNNNIGGNAQIGNDLAIDDITFKPCGPLTNASFSNIIILDSTGSTNCSTINLFGKITGSFNSPAYQWQMSKDGGITYTDIAGATTLNATYSNFINGKYFFRMLSAEAGNINSTNCRFISNKITLTVTGCSTQAISKIINEYTPVVAFNPCDNKLTVEDATKFNIGDTVLIIQMKGAVIDSSNTASFGTVTNYKNAGNYEFNYVKSKAGNIVELKNVLERQYDVPDGKVQLIRVPYFKSAVVSDTLTCLAWDGKKGGVLVLNVKDTLILNNKIDVSGKGFRKGIMHNSLINAFTCGLVDYFYPINTIYAAGKGESIADLDSTKNAGWGSKASGGGGGMDPNTGGGGGGNGGIGGIGGYGYGQCPNYTAIGGWGLGGNSLVYNSISNKFFLGGAGGAGHCNNGFSDLSVNTDFDGGNGGGMVLIAAPVISGENNSVISNGDNAYELTAPGFLAHDGMGGGGAGGTILIKSNSVISGLQIKVNGGKGGNMSSSITGGKVGPGGGGAGGVAWFSQNALPANVTIQKNAGLNGVILDDGNNPYGATKGFDGINVFNLSFSTATVPFKINIDSVRIKTATTGCNAFSLNGLAYTNTAAINKWEWFFDDGSTASTQNTTHSYTVAGNHPVKLIITDINGCKDSVTININAIALPPNATSTITQPTCVNTFGSISIINPLAANLQYSIDGINYQTGIVFPNVAPGTYNLTVKNTANNCLSAQIPVIITAATTPGSATSNIAQPTCTNSFGIITVSAPLGANLQFSVDGINYQSATVFTNVNPGPYNLTVKNTSSGCVSTPAVVNINPALQVPVSPATNITQPACTNASGAINITAPLAANLQYSIDGTNYQPSTVFTNVTPATYTVTTKNTSSGCISMPSTAIITAVIIPGTPIQNTTQPTCANAFGTITITAPLGANLQYSVDGISYQSATIFTNVNPGPYNLTVKNTGSGCISNQASVTVNPALPVPSQPLNNVTQPVCVNQNGTITVTAPLGAALQYSIDGINYQAAVGFANVIPGTYNLTAKNSTSSCISSSVSVIITPGTGTPATPVANVSVQPDCVTTKGTINITSPLAVNYTYSIDGSNYQAAATFTTINPGNYNVLVKNTTNNCVSTVTPVTVNPLPLPPVAPAVTVLQPTCAITTGSINITSPTGSTIEYSINGIAYQPATSFTALVPADYTIVAKNTSTQCVSASTVAVINTVPSAPQAPTVGAIIQPTCSVLKGTVTINAPVGSTLEYSINGSNYQIGTSFNNLGSGTYNFAVRDIVTSCISTATAASINPSPVLPTAPVATVSVQPSCVISAGTIAISAPAGSNYEYSIDGLQYQAATTFTGLAPNTYPVTVKDLSTGCVSSPTILAVNADISLPGKYLIPTAFTPNNDGINDCFGIKFWGVVTEFQLIIYNRWGETVFSTTNPSNCWDGKHKSVTASQGNYVYFIKAKTLCGPVEKKGNVLLVR